MYDLNDRAGFYAQTQNLSKQEIHDKLLRLFRLIEFADLDLKGDYNWELAKDAAGIKSEATKSK